MRTVFDYITGNWFNMIIPVVVFIVSIIALFWLRKWALDRLERWSKKINWALGNTLIPSLRGPTSLLCLILSIFLGVAVSNVPDNWKLPISNSLWSLFTAAIALTLVGLTTGMIFFYGRKYNLTRRAVFITRNVTRIVILGIAVLVILGIWGVPTSPVLLVIAILILIAVIAFRDAAPNLFASFQLAAGQEIKVGDYIKLDTGGEGYVKEMSWNNTRLQASDGSIILVPNNMLIHRKIINYGRPLKKAKEPFHFNTRTHLAELTGLKARNLRELAEMLKVMPDPVIYYHTHQFLEKHQYIIPELSNDIAGWVKDSVGNDILAERLANVSIYEFDNLSTFRDTLVRTIEEYIAQDGNPRDVSGGREFYFIKSVSVILPTSYVAHDLREFVEALRKISPSSLFFHIFESRLRLGSKVNDFSIWLEKSMDEKELGQELARIDPYNYTLEGLRSLLIQVIEKHIK
jgi:small-conductance mechanosensitive channel